MEMTRGEEKRCRIKLTRSIFLAGKHAERGEIVEVEVQLADWLIEQRSAKRHLWLRLSDRVRSTWRQLRERRVV